MMCPSLQKQHGHVDGITLHFVALVSCICFFLLRTATCAPHTFSFRNHLVVTSHHALHFNSPTIHRNSCTVEVGTTCVTKLAVFRFLSDRKHINCSTRTWMRSCLCENAQAVCKRNKIPVARVLIYRCYWSAKFFSGVTTEMPISWILFTSTKWVFTNFSYKQEELCLVRWGLKMILWIDIHELVLDLFFYT